MKFASQSNDKGLNDLEHETSLKNIKLYRLNAKKILQNITGIDENDTEQIKEELILK